MSKLSKQEADELNRLADQREASSELLVHKCMSNTMSVAEKFRYNLCLKIQEIKLSVGAKNGSFEDVGISSEEMRRIQHKHYDFFETDRLLEILSIVMIKTKSGRIEDLKLIDG